MIAEKTKAGAGTPAKNNTLQKTSYPSYGELSSRKEVIGYILLLLTVNTNNVQGWSMLEHLLREYYEVGR